ncbi:NAD(P)/FAD-dependent oxidoreductase [Anaerococcus nagyae]|jgi:FAD-dependent pyridine nucleotide-disulphide oxidoreductase|uniref:NAD(P)/FAD-dependent oxidoreductase n=2 Tax=Anaerococcus TaxID=165779 RepID=A0A3E2THL1_9FIRM|nr:FAD-dependent oxidoreductase [Anaerococcus nagyae]MBP2069918.1 nitrite reductase (NADH) large subunit [Anaerococcus nagyae]RGB75878.1 NAD(P)/FAD-dependent oxidoreductase [Anaerococcus nagyae]
MYDYLIIGNGIAGLSATEEIRKKDADAKILIVSAEKPSTYWRTRLSDLISKEFNDDDIYVKKEPWYSERHIDERLQTAVDKLDLDRNVAVLSDGEEIEYAKALLATGAHPFVPPIKNISSDGVFAIRTIDDLMNFKYYVNGKDKVIVIGGGILGLEAAYSAKLLGKKVTVIESFDYLLSRQLDQDLSQKLESTLNDMGISTYTGKNTSEILSKDGKVIGVKLDDGSTIDADAIMVQAGVRSNVEVAKNSGLEVDRGIIVDDTLQTEKENVFAAGDCAQIGNFTIGLWTSSQEMGKIAGHNMTGSNECYEKPKPFSTLMIGDTKIFSAGITSGEGIEEISSEKDGNIYKLFKMSDQYVGGILWGDIKYQNDVKNIVFYHEELENTKLSEMFK